MKKPILFIFIVLTFQAAVGQSTLSQQLTGSGGGQTDNATFKTSWSVGEAVTATASAGSYTLTQGFHQNQLLFPATQAYNIVFSNVQTTQMQADWTRGTGTKCAVFMKQASTGTSFPANNITYTANTSFTAGTQIGSTGWYCVYNDVGTNVTITNLAAGATYIMHVCEYNGTAGSEQYNTSLATDNPKSQTTGGSSDIQAHDISFSNILPVSLRADWTRGNGVQCVVFVKQGSSGTALPANNTIYNPNAAFSSGTQIGSSGWYCVYNGTGTYVTFTNLSPGTDYIVQVFEYTGSPGSEQYDISTATNNPNAQATTGTPPTQAHNIVFTNVLPTSMQADWTRGNGANCAVFVKQASSGLATPSDNTTYTGNASFVSGTQIGSSGWYCVYNGTATTVTVTDITPGLAYLMHVCEYNAPPGSEQYNTSTASGNPNSPILNGLSGTIEAFTDVTCNTAGNGTITISASGGYGTFEYSSDGSTWVGGPGSPYVFTGLTPGTYHMWIRDAVNTASELFLNDQIITQPDVLAELSSTHTNVSCFNGNNGTVTVAATGGTPAYVYSLLPGSHGDGTSSGVFTGLTAGTYTYSMTDANSCGPVTGKLVVTEPTQIGGTSNIDTYVSCEGLCDGIVIVTATGGTSPYRYALNGASWSLLTVSPYVFTDLCATTYTAHIMDNNGCTGDVVFTMVQSYYGPKAQFGTPDPTCVGQKVCIAVQGRDMYVSSPDPNHPDALVCAISLKFQYDPSVMTLLPFDVGTWNPSIPWTDHVGFGYNSLNVTNTLVSTHVALIRIGGFGDSFGFGTSGLGTLVNLCFTYHGQYNVLGDALTWVDDGNNKTECEFAYFVTGVGSVKYCDLPNDHYYFPGTVSGPTLALANANGSPSHTDDNCYGGYGTITLQASGGTTPYHYTLNPGPLTSGAQPGAYTFTGLVARTYTYSITDAHDCGPVTGTLDVTQSDPLLCSTGHTDVTCNPTPDGTITVYASGGFGTYNYSKDNGGTFEGGTGNSYTFTGLAQGTYSIAIRDAAHTACVHQCGVTDITQPPLLSVTTSSDQTVCQGTTFTVSVSVTGGTGPYSYHWEDPLPSATIYDNAGAITGTASFSPHNGTWHVTVTDSHSCTISGTAKLTVTLPHTLTGTLRYNNTENIALGRLQNVELWLYDDIGSGYSHHDPLWEAVTAAINGAYSFSNICCGTYRLAVHTNPYDPGSVNATDAYQVQYWWQIHCTPNPQAIQLVNFWAGDVYGAGSGLPNEQINSTDAERIQAYFVYGGNCPGSMGACFDRLPWSYAKAGVTVACEGNHPTSADEDIMVNVCGANQIQDLLAQVTGNFNASYLVGGAKDASAKVRLTYGQTKQVSPNREFDLPVYVVNPMKVGATSLILNFPANLVEVKDVIMDGGLLDWNVNGNELRIGWHTLNPQSLNGHANLVTLRLRTTGDFTVGTSIRLSLVANQMNELADQFAKPIPDAILSVDVIEASPIGIPENLSASDLTLDNHPNPFSNETMFDYSLPFDGNVTLVIHNLLGETMKTLINESQTQGDHTFRFDAGSMANGIYTATIKLDANSARLERTIKLIRNK